MARYHLPQHGGGDMGSVDGAWSRIEGWLAANLRDELRHLKLPGPASQAELAAAEQHLGAPLPATLRASLLRHDGEPFGICAGHGLLSASRLYCRQAPDGQSSWLGFAEPGLGLWLDLKDGCVRYEGQMAHVVAGDFAVFLTSLADDLEQGRGPCGELLAR